MDNLARKQAAWDVAQDVGRVIGVGAELRVRVGAEELRARRAVSCLVEPALGDDVLVAVHAAGVHVLAVLERGGEEPLALRLDGDASLEASGALRLGGAEGVAIVSPAAATIAAGSVEIAAAAMTAAVGAVRVVADEVEGRVDRLRTTAKSLETVADRWVQRLSRAFRFVEEIEQVKAGFLEYSAKSAAHLSAKATLIASEEVTKVDGAQIHVG